ncbi:MAG: DUF2283 domain-containing protein [Xanthobacteraceae bacterium]|jgi:uncharacterized protein YuzE
MRVRVDHAADAVYLNLTDRPIKDSAEVADGIVVDYDNEGRIVGVEILDASKRTDDPDALKNSVSNCRLSGETGQVAGDQVKPRYAARGDPSLGR